MDPSVAANQYNSALPRDLTSANFVNHQQSFNNPSMYPSPMPMAPLNNPSPMVPPTQSGYGSNLNTSTTLSRSQTPVAQEALETNDRSMAAPGWNDPPTLHRSLKNQVSKNSISLRFYHYRQICNE